MTPEQFRDWANLPLDESRSRLEPYKDLILRWRRQGRGYTRIRELLAEKCSVTVSRQVLTRFIQKRAKPRKAQLDLDLEQTAVQPLEPLPVIRSAVAKPSNSDQSSDPFAEARERMRKHKEAAAVRKSEPLYPIYTDDELLEPHVLKPKTKEEN